jgi:ssDNA-binding Zn-finger/Zn-ribbon topoisomerase 1
MHVEYNQSNIKCSSGHQNIAIGNKILNDEINRFQSGVPLCKNCGSRMEKRKQRSNAKKFWGCSKYPKCSYTMSIR